MTVGKPGPPREPVVAFEEVSKAYGSVRAVDGLSLDLRHGETVDQTLKRAGIADRRVDKLSGGQTQRARFALAIVGECGLIVLDEPTTAMDVESREMFWANMHAEVAEGRTLLFATHYLEEADQAADRILVINKGRLVADGTPAEIKERAGAKRISFRLDPVDEAFLLRLPALVNLEIRRDQDPHPVLRLRPHAVRTMQKIAQVLPTYQITRIGTGVILNGTVSMTAIGVILAWLAGFIILAALSVRSTAEKI